MREIKFIVIHCTATSQFTLIENIKRYWSKILHWKSNGYHFIIKANGEIVQITDLKLITNGVKGYNKNSVHISYIGGVNLENQPTDNRTNEQKKSLLQLIQDLKNKFPNALILGHRDFPNVHKACPSFNAKKEYANIVAE